MIELGKDGLLAAPSHHDTESSHERRQLLEDRRRRWQTLRWMDNHTVPLNSDIPPSFNDGIAWDFVGGVFATVHGPIGADQRGSWLRTIYLPGPDIPTSTITWKEISVSVQDFTIDPSQDLVAYTEHVDQ
jgi:hypothetical protein